MDQFISILKTKGCYDDIYCLPYRYSHFQERSKIPGCLNCIFLSHQVMIFQAFHYSFCLLVFFLVPKPLQKLGDDQVTGNNAIM